MLIIEDGIVHVVKKIMPNQEIFTGYTEEEHNMQKSQPSLAKMSGSLQ
jgi:hypothetical protein